MRKAICSLFGIRYKVSTAKALYLLDLGFKVRNTRWKDGVFIASGYRFIYVYVQGPVWAHVWKRWTPYPSDFAPGSRWETVL